LEDRDPNLSSNRRRNKNRFTFKMRRVIGYLRYLQQ
jgi:hypothetical protein